MRDVRPGNDDVPAILRSLLANTPAGLVSDRRERGARTELSRKQYEDLPLSERINLVLQKRVRFYRHDGSEVGAAEAMRGI